MSEALIHFPIDQGLGQGGQKLVYRPHSTRTLKLRVTTTAGAPALPPLRLRPHRVAGTAATGQTVGYADEGDAFLVSWGGGHENGPCVKADDQGGYAEGCVPLTAAEPGNIYLNLTHRGDQVPGAVPLTLEAYDPATGDVHASLTLTLEPPAAFPGDLMTLAPGADGTWSVTGRHLPRYDPRWWPEEAVTYQEAAPPPLTIRQDKARLLVDWPGREELVIVISDNTRPSLLAAGPDAYAPSAVNFELFDFDPHHFILRVWFFWLNTNIGFKFSEALRHEVPDAERFDFLIRKAGGKVVLACTDFHWQEIWGQVVAWPLYASFGFTKGTILQVAIGQAGKKLANQSKHKLPYNPLGYIERLAEHLLQRDRAGGAFAVLAKGWEAHVPTMTKVEYDPLMASSDVRMG